VANRAKKYVFELELFAARKLEASELSYTKALENKESYYKQKLNLEFDALEIFTLYEITKEITKTLQEDLAFQTFKKKLIEHVKFDECKLLDPLSDEVKEWRKAKHYVFTLQGKKKKIGYLAFKGVSESDKEKISILGHQFALGLRRVRLYQEIEKIAITDSLTEVFTRRYTMDRFNEEIKRSRLRKIPMSFLMIDVDHFKNINDSFGHLTGDLVLREIAKIIKDNIREIDVAGRYGGEEFCIILPDTDREGAMYAAERIRVAAEKTAIKAYDTRIKTTLSIGITTFADDGKDMDELIDKADWALYRAKKQGRNRVCAFGVYKSE